MKLLIDISEVDHEIIQIIVNSHGLGTKVDEAIANGIKIPEYSGRLISAEWLKTELGDTNMDIFTNEVKEMIDSAPTIIPATEEVEDEETS